MTALLIALAVIIVAGVLALLLTAPMMRRRKDEAVDRAIAEAGGKEVVRLVEAKAVGHGTKPEEAGGLRGAGALASSPETLSFVTWNPQKVFTIAKSSITEVSTQTAQVSDAVKGMVDVTFDGESGPVTASFRMGDPGDWLDELGYDWGPDGRPVTVDDD